MDAPGKTSPLRFTFPRSLKIKSRTTIETLYKQGRKRSHHPLVAHGVRREDNKPARIAISIGKACGNSPQRNTIKRKLREAFRLIQHEVPPGSDYLLVVRPHKIMDMQAYQSRLRQLLRGDTIKLEAAPATVPPRRGKGPRKERKK
jgi:ribonuclease P protein component